MAQQAVPKGNGHNEFFRAQFMNLSAWVVKTPGILDSNSIITQFLIKCYNIKINNGKIQVFYF
jgi:hypothetical protein